MLALTPAVQQMGALDSEPVGLQWRLRVRDEQ
jgi:hypothetical protein